MFSNSVPWVAMFFVGWCCGALTVGALLVRATTTVVDEVDL